MIRRLTFRFSTSLAAIAIFALVFVPSGFAATYEQMVEQCREQARPAVVACVHNKGGCGGSGSRFGRGGGGGPNPEIIEACRASVGKPLVFACVDRLQQRQAAGTPAPAAPKEEKAAAPQDVALVQRAFVTPPRTIADITAILDQEKPDDAKIVERKAKADAAPPNNAPAAKLAQFYLDRGSARALLGRNKEALADGLQGLAVAKGNIGAYLLVHLRQFVSLQYKALGDPQNSIAMAKLIERDGNIVGQRGSLVEALAHIVRTLISMGDLSQAAAYANRIQQRIEEARGSVVPLWRQRYSVYGRAWEADVDSVHGAVFEARGQYTEAEAAYRRAEAFRRAAVKDLPRYDGPTSPEQLLQAADSDLLAVARNESKEGRLSEAEADARRALLETLKALALTAPQVEGQWPADDGENPRAQARC